MRKRFPFQRLIVPALTTAMVLAAAFRVQAAEEEAPEAGFIRFIKTSSREGHVDTKIARYKNASGITVTLYGAIHIADRSYYDELQRRFATHDALLYEMVKPDDLEPSPSFETDSPVSRLQTGMKDLLDLKFQLDAIDYSPENFVHADMSPEAFAEAQEAQDESLFSVMFQAAMEEMRRSQSSGNPLEGLAMLFALTSRDSAYALKFVFAQQIGEMESIIAGVDKRDGRESVLLSGRNRIALQRLEEQLEKGIRNPGIFYGAGHMIDMEERLATMGFQKTDEEWLVAWDLKPSGSR